ncbi:MAG: NAD(P)H-dependent oxidoreductase [Acidipropionibacterium sp.]|nr:NAD(P)H-dependent oxidoreductase [Acidipropionibacterium sp.]
MKTLVLVFHPNLSRSRINRRLMQEAQKAADDGREVTVRDEYGLWGNGHIDVASEHAVMEQHDRIVLQFPFYWYSSPSLVKEWEDQVLEYGWAYGSAGDALHGKELIVAASVGAQAADYAGTGPVGHSVEELLSPFDATSRLIGITYRPPFLLKGVMNFTDAQLEQGAKEYIDYILDEAA